MDKPKATPKDFFLWAGAMLALFVGVFNYIALFWNYIDYAFPDPLAYNYGSYIDPYQNGISWEMATLIILTPTFLLLMWIIRRDIARDPSRSDIWVRRWALFLTLFVASITMIVDLIYVLYAFLNGSDITTQFLLKALIVLFVAAIGFMHFIADLWGYWKQYPARNRSMGIATLVLVLLTVIAGFFIVGTPAQARDARFDEQKVSDLQTIQSQILSYWQAKGALPPTLADLSSSFSGFSVPMDPQSGASYTYDIKSTLSFDLCANFNAPMQSYDMQDEPVAAPMLPGSVSGQNNSWTHTAGTVCFVRTIDPQLYAPQSQKTP